MNGIEAILRKLAKKEKSSNYHYVNSHIKSFEILSNINESYSVKMKNSEQASKIVAPKNSIINDYDGDIYVLLKKTLHLNSEPNHEYYLVLNNEVLVPIKRFFSHDERDNKRIEGLFGYKLEGIVTDFYELGYFKGALKIFTSKANYNITCTSSNDENKADYLVTNPKEKFVVQNNSLVFNCNISDELKNYQAGFLIKDKSGLDFLEVQKIEYNE